MSIYSALEKKERKYSDRRLFSMYVSRMLPFKKQIFYLCILIFTSIGLTIVTPLVAGQAIDELSQLNPNMQYLWIIGVIYAVLIVSNWIISYTRQIIYGRITPFFLEKLRMDIFDKLQSQDMSFFDRNQRGDLNTRVTSDSSEFGSMTFIFADFISNIIISIGVFTFLIIFDPILAVVTIAGTSTVLITVYLFRKLLRSTTKNFRESVDKVNSSLVESVEGIHVAKNYGQELNISEKFEKTSEEYRQTISKRVITNILIWPIFGVMVRLTTVAIVFLWSNNLGLNLSSGNLYMAILYIGEVFYPVISIGTFYAQIQGGFVAFERILEIIDSATKVIQGENPRRIEHIRGDIKFENVGFTYDSGPKLFDNFNLHIYPGERVAIVGQTGSGKSSLISLLARFYEFQDGDIKIDDISIRDLDLSDYRTHLGIVQQEVFLFNGTIADNIKYGRMDASEEDVWNAIKAVHAEELIEYLPDKLDSMVGERGKSLSTGQRQLISFARALLADPQILILDEATSSVDAYTEAIIQEALEELLENRTSIIIAHRLSTILNSDRILVMHKGQIIEEGTHEDLLNQNGHYASLYEQYFEHHTLEWQAKTISALSQ
ncbi:MAG: ABC transporter ATP-binding protein [Candidatus Heimdallarchaeota archaeon]|nr:ABC transporter ATP-binding protein [Candidatus Heimdallarchaeota archaeon]